jgi:hypothetical protein
MTGLRAAHTSSPAAIATLARTLALRPSPAPHTPHTPLRTRASLAKATTGARRHTGRRTGIIARARMQGQLPPSRGAGRIFRGHEPRQSQ